MYKDSGYRDAGLLQLTDGFNGADLRNVVTEAGMFAIRDDRYVLPRRVLHQLSTTPPASTLSKKISRKLHARSAMPRNTRVCHS